MWVYALLFAIIFCETGLVVTPFLPGDSLLFVAGAVAAAGDMNIGLLMATLVAAALCGDNVNYFVGRWIGPRVFHFEKSRWFNPAHLQRAHAFYEKHGGKTIILARFVPIVRTYVPFVAGVGMAVVNLSWNLTVQEKVPEQMLSRVMAVDGFFSFVAMPVGQLAVGPLALAFGAQDVMLGCAALCVLVGVVGATRPAIREVRLVGAGR